MRAEIGTEQRLAAGERQPQHAVLGALVEHPEPLVGGELARLGVSIVGGEVHVAVDAGEVAAVGQLEAGGDGEAFAHRPQMQDLGQTSVDPRNVDGELVAHDDSSPRESSSAMKASTSRSMSTPAGIS